MSSSPAEVTVEAPPQPETSALSPENFPEPIPPRKSPVVKIAALAVAVIALAGTLLLGFRRNVTPAVEPVRSATAADSLGTLRLKGSTEAVQSRGILAPVLAGQQSGSLTLTKLTPGGRHVKRGELLAEFDRQAQVRDFMDRQADYNKLVEQVAGEQAKENATRAKDETELKTAEDNLRKAELEIQKAEIVSRIDAEKNQENLDEAKATYDQLRETFDLKRKAAHAAIRILEIQRDRTQQTMEHSRANSDLMQIHSPIDGVVVLNTIWKSGTMGEIQEGDQVWPGQGFMQVVDPTAMQVRVLANQVDFLRLQTGQTARVRLDAYPELVFPAKLAEEAPVGRNGAFSDKLRTFVVLFSIQGNDAKLMPDLSAAVDVDVSGHDSAAASASGTSTTGTRSGS